MKKSLIVVVMAMLAFGGSAMAQKNIKLGHINSNDLMQIMPGRDSAQAALQKEVDELRQQYQQEAYLLPENLKQRRQDEIRTKEADLRKLQQQRFAPGGDLDQKRAELMKPVQDRIYNAIERVAREKNYAFVFDKAASATVLYVAEKYDISNQVLEMLGVKPGSSSDNGGTPATGAPAMGKGNSPAGRDQKNSSSDNLRKEGR